MIRITKTHFHDQKNNHFQFRFPNKMKIRIRNMFLSLRLGKPTITHLNNRSTLDEMSRILFDQRDDPRPTQIFFHAFKGIGRTNLLVNALFFTM